MRFLRSGSFRGRIPRVAARRVWNQDGRPGWEFRFTPPPVITTVPAEAPPAVQPRRSPVRFVSSRGVEIGGDVLRIDQFHHRIRRPTVGRADEPEQRTDVAGALVALATDPDDEAAQHRVLTQVAFEHPWFRSVPLLDISAARITGGGLGHCLDGVFVWRAEGRPAEGGRGLTYLVVPDPDTKDLLAADPDLLRALLRAACPDPDAALGELEGDLREAITRLGVAAGPVRRPERPRTTSPSRLVLEVDPALDTEQDRGGPVDRPKSESERALSEELAELARKVRSASAQVPAATAPDRPSKAG
jgi:hypothetical protein